MLGDRAVDPAPQRLDRHSTPRASVKVDIAKINPKLLDDLQPRRRVEFGRPL